MVDAVVVVVGVVGLVEMVIGAGQKTLRPRVKL